MRHAERLLAPLGWGVVIFACVAAKIGFSVALAPWTAFFSCLAFAVWADVKDGLVPVFLFWPMAVFGVTCAFGWQALAGPGAWPGGGKGDVTGWQTLAGLALGWGILAVTRAVSGFLCGRECLGSGDAPMLGMIGAFMGWKAVPAVILVSSATGFAAGLASLALGRLWKKQGHGLALPFGPFLALGAAACFWLELRIDTLP